MSALTLERYSAPLARMESSNENTEHELAATQRKLFEIGASFVQDIQNVEGLLREDLKAGIERGVVARFLEELLPKIERQAAAFQRAIQLFPEANDFAQHLRESERIQTWMQSILDRVTKPLPELNAANLPPRTPGPKSKGYMTSAEVLEWLASQPE